MGGSETRHRIEAGDGELRLIDLWKIVRQGRRVIFICVAVGAAIAVLLGLSMDDIYRAQVVLAPSAEEGPAGPQGGALANVAAIAGIRMPGNASVSQSDEAIAIVRSRRFTEDFIRRERILPILLPEWEDTPSIISRLSDGVAALIGLSVDHQEGKGEEADANRGRRTSWAAYKVFHEIRQVEVDQEVGLVTLSVDWTDPVLAAEWANKLVSYINHELRAREIDSAERNISYLQAQVDVTVETDRRRLLFNLIEGETRRIMLAKSRDEFAFRVIDPAIIPQEKARPQRALMVVVGSLGGLVLGLLILVIRHAMQDDREVVL